MDAYKHAYRVAFDFHTKHINAKTDSDWQDACDDMINEPDDFTRSLMQTIYTEIERKNALLKQ